MSARYALTGFASQHASAFQASLSARLLRRLVSLLCRWALARSRIVRRPLEESSVECPGAANRAPFAEMLISGGRRPQRADMLSTQPGLDYHPEDPERVGELRRLLRLAGGAAEHGDGHLLEAQLVLEPLEDYLRGVEAVLAQVELVQLGDPYRPEAVRAVADLNAREQRDQLREKDDADVADAAGLLVEAHEAGAEHEVRPILDDGRHEALDLLGLVLAVGVEVDDDVGALSPGYLEARAQCVALAAVDDVGDYGEALLAGDGRRGVVRAVVDHHDLDLVAQDLLRHPAQHLPYAPLLVVGGNDDEDLAPLREPLFRRKVLLRVLADGEARDYLAVSAPRLLHLVEQVEEQGEEQQGRERQEREAAVLQSEQAGKDLAHLRDHRDQGHPEGDEEAEEQAEPAVPAATVPEDAVHREEYGDDYTSEAHVLCRHRLAPATKYMPARLYRTGGRM